MKRHKFNIFPEMSKEDYQKLIDDLRVNGFDSSQPIVIYEGDILDGWNRFKACQELDIPLVERQFFGSQVEAINFVMRTNKRRNLTSQQWAAIAVDADDIVRALEEETERERREKQIKSRQEAETKKLSDNFLSDNSEALEEETERERRQKQAKTLAETLEKNGDRVCDKKLSQTPDENNPVQENPQISNDLEQIQAEAAADIAEIQEQQAVSSSDIEEIANEQAEAVSDIQELTYEYDHPPKKDSQSTRTATKLAKTFGTNRAYINEAKKLKESAPEKLEQVKRGETTFQQIKKEQSEPNPPPLEDDSTDDFTVLATKHGRTINGLVKELQEAITTAHNEFFRLGQNFDSYGEIRRLSMTPLNEMEWKSRLLKTLKKCANCKAQEGGCKWCKKTGYQDKSSYSTTKSAIS